GGDRVSMLLSPRRELGEFKKRYKWMALFVVALFLVIVVRLVQLQVADGAQWQGTARENVTKTFSLPATRGLIRDAGGRVITANRPSYNVFITPQAIRARTELDLFASLMGMSTEQQAAF